MDRRLDRYLEDSSLIFISLIPYCKARASTALASHQAIVLLKNVEQTLPLRTGTRVAVIGPNGNRSGVLAGNYAGAWCPLGPHGRLKDCTPSIYMAIQTFDPSALFAVGCDISGPLDGGIAAAVTAAQSADCAILVLGLDLTMEG